MFDNFHLPAAGSGLVSAGYNQDQRDQKEIEAAIQPVHRSQVVLMRIRTGIVTDDRTDKKSACRRRSFNL
jgi:hypothetical protein